MTTPPLEKKIRMDLMEKERRESFASMQEKPSSPIPDVQSDPKSSYSISRWHIESELLSENKSVTRMGNSTYTYSAPSLKNLTSPILTALTSLSEGRIEVMSQGLKLRKYNDITQTSSESMALKTLCGLMNTSAKMEQLLLKCGEESISTSFLRTFAMCFETVAAGLATAVDCLKANQSGQSSDQMDKSSRTLPLQERKETSGSGGLLIPARPSGLKRKSTATRTTKSVTTGIPSTSTQINKSSSTTTSCPRRNIFSSSEIIQHSPVLCPETQDIINAQSLVDLSSGPSSAQIDLSPSHCKKKENQP